MEKHHYKLLILILILIAALGILFMRLTAKTNESKSTPESLPIAQAQVVESTNVISPDGKMSLTLKKEKMEGNVKYNFLLTNSANGAQTIIFTKTVASDSTLSIPFNTFSPDDKYIFLKEENSGQSNYFVLTTTGAQITTDLQTYDISTPFAAKYPDLKVTEMTGWGGVNLIVINTDKKGGGKGPSFWFEVPSKNFIQLSNRFD